MGISQASFQFYFSIQQLSWGVSTWHISLILFSFLLNEGKKKKVKFPLWAVSMLGCSWPRTLRNFSIKEGGTTCSKWASYLSILRSLSYATMELEVFWSCINPTWCGLFGKLRMRGDSGFWMLQLLSQPIDIFWSSPLFIADFFYQSSSMKILETLNATLKTFEYCCAMLSSCKHMSEMALTTFMRPSFFPSLLLCDLLS